MKYNYEENPFTDGEFRVSTATLIGVLEYLKDSNQSFSGAAQRYNIGQNVLIKIFDKYVKPKRLKLPRVLSIDEVHIKSKTKYPYACVLLDFERNKIVDVLKTRHKDYLIKYFSKFSVKELDSVEYVTMDLWDTYKAVIKRFMPKAKIIADPFHVVTNINRILDKKRIQVMNYYLNVNKKDLNYSNDFGYLLKTYRNLITINPDKFYAKYIWIQKYKIKVYSINLLKHLLTSNKELEEIYNIRNIYQRFNADTTDINAANIELKKLIKKFMNHEISEIRKYGNLLNLWKNEVCNSFIRHNKIRYTNAKLESKNRDIKTILKNAHGFKNFQRFRARVIYSLNKDVAIKLY